MNILLIGSGGREHALAWAIAASPLCDRLFVAPGNPGTDQIARNAALEVTDHAAVIGFCRAENNRPRRGGTRSAAGRRAGG
jgi:phosphoribosylamine---glycine ligase